MIFKNSTPQSRRLVTTRQRQELYSLNQLMTRLEKEAFAKVHRVQVETDRQMCTVHIVHRTSRCLTCRCAEKEVTVRALRLLSRCHSFFWSILVTHVVIHPAAQFNTVKQLLLNSSKTVTQVLIFLAINPSWNFKVPSHNNAFNQLWWQFEPTMLNANPQSDAQSL